MPANLDTENRMHAQIAANADWKERLFGTFQGWLMRYAIKCGTAFGAAVTGYLAGQTVAIESLAARMGADHDTLVQLHNALGGFSEALAALAATLVVGGISTALSRVAAKVAEKPVVPKAPPVE